MARKERELGMWHLVMDFTLTAILSHIIITIITFGGCLLLWTLQLAMERWAASSETQPHLLVFFNAPCATKPQGFLFLFLLIPSVFLYYYFSSGLCCHRSSHPLLLALGNRGVWVEAHHLQSQDFSRKGEGFQLFLFLILGSCGLWDCGGSCGWSRSRRRRGERTREKCCAWKQKLSGTRCIPPMASSFPWICKCRGIDVFGS